MEYEALTEIAALTVFFSTGVLWLITAIQVNRVRLHFLRDCPEEAKKYVRPPGFRSPKNVNFLFRKDALAILKLHYKLWTMRKHAIKLLIASVIWPILCMVSLGIVLSQFG
jgi:hypothetical protein